jgi:D-alanyl-D-alanine carboxypeptidase
MIPIVAAYASVLLSALAVDRLSPPLATSIDRLGREELAQERIPGMSVAVAYGGQIVYSKGYGFARLDPRTPATAGTTYSIGSITKQFTAAAVMHLVEAGKLSLDDAVAKYFPDLTAARDVRIKNLLTHTSGYRDYYPLDYVDLEMKQPTTAASIMQKYGRMPLDFTPGTRISYSNTNYIILGAIIAKVSGVPYRTFMEKTIFSRLHAHDIHFDDPRRFDAPHAAGYTNFDLSPPLLAQPEAEGWVGAAGAIASSAPDLASWDLALMSGKVVSPASFSAMAEPAVLKNGENTHYGFGLSIKTLSGHRALEHEGGVSGFITENLMLPDARLAVIVLTDADYSSPDRLSQKIAELFEPRSKESRKSSATAVAPVAPPPPDSELAAAKMWFHRMQVGHIDRDALTADFSAFLSDSMIAGAARTLGPFGTPRSFSLTDEGERGGMTTSVYRVTFARRVVQIWMYRTRDAKLAEYFVWP